MALSAVALLLVGLGSAPAVAAQQLTTDANDAWCERNDRGGDDRARHCEVRSTTISAASRFDVDASPNGGIDIEGWDRDEISIEARVQAYGRDDEEARALADEIEIVVDDDGVRTDAPRVRGRDRGWSVSYRIRVPVETDLELRSVNGGIGLAGVRGDIDLRTTNGGLSLRDVGGDVRGRSTNGGIEAVLSGNRWTGGGLDLETTNGGIQLAVPDGYSARLETGATNGGYTIDFPVTVEGRVDPRRISVDLGDGGPTIRAFTTNGGVRIRRS